MTDDEILINLSRDTLIAIAAIEHAHYSSGNPSYVEPDVARKLIGALVTSLVGKDEDRRILTALGIDHDHGSALHPKRDLIDPALVIYRSLNG